MIDTNFTALKVLYWNANSIFDKTYELYDYLLENNVHVCLISETCLNVSIKIPSHRDFMFIRLDREADDQRSSGGVGIFIRRHLKFEILSVPDTKLIESLGIRIFSTNSHVDLFSVYLPGGAVQSTIRQHFRNDIAILTRNRSAYYIMGDLNAKHRAWNCSRSNLAGRILFDEQLRSDFVVLFPPSPTHFPFQSRAQPSTIDLSLTNGLLSNSNLLTEKSASDHDYVYFTIELCGQIGMERPDKIPLFSQANWKQYRLLVHLDLANEIKEVGRPRLVYTRERIDQLIVKLSNVMLNRKTTCVPHIKPNHYALKLSDEIKQMIRDRNQLRNIVQRHPQYRDDAMPIIRQLERQIKDFTNKARNDDFARLVEQIPENDPTGKIWKLTKMLKRHKNIMPPLKNANNQVLITSHEKSNALGEQFITNYDNPLENDNKVHTKQINARVARFCRNCVTHPEYANLNEIRCEVKRLKNNTAAGFDGIQSPLIKNLPDTGLLLLLIIINSCLYLGYFPKNWKHAKMIGIRKPDKPAHLPSSYRPISLLSTLSKVLERIILSRVKSHLESHNIIPSIQHGFQEGRSTTTQLYQLINDLRRKLRNKLSIGILLLDIEKAFDRVWSNGLLSKMIDIKLPAYLIKIAQCYLTDRTFQLYVQGSLSRMFKTKFGLPQGGICSPCFYNVYTYDQPKINNATASIFADDTGIRSSSRFSKQIVNNLTTATNTYINYFKRWKIKVNTSKFQAIFITKRRAKQLPTQPLQIKNDQISWSDVVKYLGLLIDKRLTLQPHYEYALNKAMNAMRSLYSLLNRRSKLNTRNKIKLYKQAVRPTFTYASPIIADAAISHIRTMQIFQNKLLRMILDIRWNPDTLRFSHTSAELHETANIEYVETYMSRLKTNFESKFQMATEP